MTDSPSERHWLQQELEARQRELWRWAATQVTAWDKLWTNDYDFRNWAKTASDEVLNGGCLYEFARESRQFRCLLVLRNKPKPKELCGTAAFMEFKGNSSGYVYLLDSGWLRWLDNFLDELIANRSFAELLRNSETEVRKSLDAFANYGFIPKAVEVARASTDSPGLQNIEIQICWRHYTDTDIGKEMKQLATKLRPAEWKGPQRRGTGKSTSTIAFLDGLSAMRLASHFPKTLPFSHVRKARQERQRGTRTAVEIFDDVRLGKKKGVLVHSDLEEYAGRAKRQFSCWFPFHEAPANGITWAMRQRQKQ
jgi:hypothetical protein